MGNRLSKIITRTGDDGTTGLGDGSRVAKDSARIEALGAVDELNSCVGLLRATPGAARRHAARGCCASSTTCSTWAASWPSPAMRPSPQRRWISSRPWSKNSTGACHR